MRLLLTENTTEKEMLNLALRLQKMQFQTVTHQDNNRYSIAVIDGLDDNTRIEQFSLLPHVESVLPFEKKYKLVARTSPMQRSVISIKGKQIGGNELTLMAVPCSIESDKQMLTVAAKISQAGATVLRGGAFKPRTSPYDFQGLGEQGLQYLQAAANAYNLLSVSEVVEAQDVPLVAKYVDILQIGSRNMQNFSLLKAAARANQPIFLKRGFSATYNEFLLAAEYIMREGNPNVILCERGIRTFEPYTRNTLDLAAVPILRELTHLPIIVDPSHGTGIRNLIAPMARAAIAAGADGVMVEVHPEPDKSVSDAKQTISPECFAKMATSLFTIASLDLA